MTKPSFDVMTAIVDSFDIFRKHPKRIFAWGLLMMIPAVVMYAAMIPIFMDIYADGISGQPPAEPDFTQTMVLNAVSGIYQLVMLVVLVPVVTAVGMMIYGRQRPGSWLGLKLGMDEVRVGLVYLALMAGSFIAFMVAALVIAMVSVPLGLMSKPLGISIAIVLSIAAVVASIWGCLRLSLIAPATVARGDFGFVEGWRATKGLVWPLLGLLVMIVLVTIVISIVSLIALGLIGGLGLLVVLAISGGEISQTPLAVGIAVSVIGAVVYLVAMAFLYSLQIVLYAGPWYSVWKQLNHNGIAAEIAPPNSSPAI